MKFSSYVRFYKLCSISYLVVFVQQVANLKAYNFDDGSFLQIFCIGLESVKLVVRLQKIRG